MSMILPAYRSQELPSTHTLCLPLWKWESLGDHIYFLQDSQEEGSGKQMQKMPDKYQKQQFTKENQGRTKLDKFKLNAKMK